MFAILLFTPIYFYFFESEKLEGFGRWEWIGFGMAWWIMLGGLVGVIIQKREKRKSDE